MSGEGCGEPGGSPRSREQGALGETWFPPRPRAGGERVSRKDPPRFERVRHLADPGHERGRAQRHVAILREVPDAVERVRQLLRELALISSRVQKIRPRSCTHSKYDTVTPPAFVRMSGTRDAALGEYRVGADRGRAVRALRDHPRGDAWRVVRGDLILARGEDEDVAVELEELLVRDALPVEAPRATRSA